MRTNDERKKNELRRRFKEKMVRLDNHVRDGKKVEDVELLKPEQWEACKPKFGRYRNYVIAQMLLYEIAGSAG